MANVFDTAKYILKKTGKTSPMKLQKLCYYAQAWSLVWDGKPLFLEDFEAWKSGPVCRGLFDLTEDLSLVSEDDIIGNTENLSDVQKESINAVLEHYGDKSAMWLSSLSCSEEPRNIAIKNVLGEVSVGIISKESMLAYYSRL